jgi:bifunctional UDP-N-acetylglucosamine pyrophosphorylase / glucosamine-1-phosphate N-acetyltransferase
MNMELLIQNERQILREKATLAMCQGVHIIDPDRIDIRGELICANNVEIDINVIIEGVVNLGEGVKIGANCILKDCSVGSGTKINPYSFVEDSVIGANSFIGPYGRVRPRCKIGDAVQVGNFVEIKNSILDNGCRVNHLSFVGDADLSENVTVGAGTVTCNHNGVTTHATKIGKNAFIGSGCNLIAPLTIGNNAMIGAGSTITHDAPADKLTLARSRQVTKEPRQ